MSLSDRLQSIRFNKGAIGYNTKEVDAFVAELRTAAERDESALRTLRAKLDAFEGRSAEITRTENEAYRLLAAAKDEAEKVRAAAEAQAKTMLEDAKVRAAAAEAVTAERASAAEREAARRANETVGNARQNAAEAVTAERASAAEREAADVRARTAALFRRSAEFEEKLRRLTADTVRALAALNASAPADATVAPAAAAAPASAPTAAPAETLSMPDPTPIFASRPRRTDRVRPAESAAAPAAAETVPASASEADADNTAHDYTFAGGKLLEKDGERQTAAPRKLYDTVSVTYDGGDGYDDIKRLMESAADRKLKNPTDFAN